MAQLVLTRLGVPRPLCTPLRQSAPKSLFSLSPVFGTVVSYLSGHLKQSWHGIWVSRFDADACLYDGGGDGDDDGDRKGYKRKRIIGYSGTSVQGTLWGPTKVSLE